MKQLVYTMLIANKHTSFRLWWKETLEKYQNITFMIIVTSKAYSDRGRGTRHDGITADIFPIASSSLSNIIMSY